MSQESDDRVNCGNMSEAYWQAGPDKRHDVEAMERQGKEQPSAAAGITVCFPQIAESYRGSNF